MTAEAVLAVAREGLWVTLLLGAPGLLAALVVQMRSPRYQPWIYWLTVVLVSVVGGGGGSGHGTREGRHGP
mgnify:CR=1 FL=1